MNTKRTSSLEKSLRENIRIYRDFSGAYHIQIKKNRVSHIHFLEKMGANHIPGSAEKGVGVGAFGTHIRTMPYIGNYPSVVKVSLMLYGVQSRKGSDKLAHEHSSIVVYSTVSTDSVRGMEDPNQTALMPA